MRHALIAGAVGLSVALASCGDTSNDTGDTAGRPTETISVTALPTSRPTFTRALTPVGAPSPTASATLTESLGIPTDTPTPARTDRAALSPTPAAPQQCGGTVCAAGEVCCNASCGICTPRGAICSQRAC